MSAKTGYSPSQVSEMLDIPEATLRRYARDYADILSEGTRQPSKRRRYTDSDVLMLRRIRQYTRERKTPAEIAQLLQVVEDTPQETSALALLPQIAQEFENLRTRLADQDARITDQSAELDELRARLDRIAGELEDERKTPWFRKLFKRRD